MKIYKLTQVSLQGRYMSDFALPKVIGHYTTWLKAHEVMKNIMPLKAYNEFWCDERDYEIEEIEVQ